MASESSRHVVKRHPCPAWWTDAKLGIFIHWTPSSVAGWAPTDRTLVDILTSTAPDAFAEMPYTEWYQNSLRFPDSSVSRHHRDVWGNRPYEEFADGFRAGLDQWDPDGWARRFAAAGARYVVLVAKHHDGFCLWPSEVANPNRDGWHTGRDVVGELGEAVRGAGLRFGVYYSGGLDWTFDDRPLGNFADTAVAVPRGAYPAYAEAQVRELVTRYRPSVLWNDIAWPQPQRELWDLLAWYYATVPDGVVNDRFLAWSPAFAALRVGPVRRAVVGLGARAARRQDGLVPPTPAHYDFRTPEYSSFAEVQRRPWECVRGIDRSFGYNRASDPGKFIGHDELVGLLVDVTAKGGNLLLNVGPRGEDAAIPEEQARRLDWLARWMGAHGEAVAATRPWVRASATTPGGTEVRFTARDDTIWCVLHRTPDGRDGTDPGASVITIPGVRPRGDRSTARVGGVPVPFTPTTGGVELRLTDLRERTPGDGADGTWSVVALEGFDASDARAA